MSVLHNCYNVDTGPGIAIVAGVTIGTVVFAIIIIALAVLIIFILLRREPAGDIQVNMIQHHNVIIGI